MKYQFECTEAETLAYIAAAGQALDKALAFIERRIDAAFPPLDDETLSFNLRSVRLLTAHGT